MSEQMSKVCTRSRVQVVLIIVLNALSVGMIRASERLYYIVGKADWQANVSPVGYRPASFRSDGFVALLTAEQVAPTANRLFQGRTDLLLLKLDVSSADPLLKWVSVPGSDASVPHYCGELPRALVMDVYPFRPGHDGRFALPAAPLLKRLLAHALPASTIDKFLNYQDWQHTDRFQRLQVRNFRQPKVQLQWWYFDFFLNDGSSVVLAFIPQHWWEKAGSVTETKALFSMSLKTPKGQVRRFSATVPQSELKTSADHLEISDRFVLRSAGVDPGRSYTIQVNFPEVSATFIIRPTKPPFAAFPTGVMPGILQTILSGAPLGAPSFSYVSQIPHSVVTGSLAWDEYKAPIAGQAYHEQGRLADTPEHQAANWSWYHFSGDGWNIFGTPGSYIYLQQGDRIVRSGFHLRASDYTLQNRAFSSPDHPKIMTGGQIDFRHENIVFRLTMRSSMAKTLVCFPSPDPNQVWGTVEGPATLSISEGPATRILNGRMFLETCSWETTAGPKSKSALTASNPGPASSLLQQP